MLKIKLSPRGKKHQRTFRIVVAEQRSKVDGRFVDEIGFYTPDTKTLNIDNGKLATWQKNGAQPTIGVDKLLHPEKYPSKPKKKISKEVKEKPPVAPAPAADTPNQ